MLDNYISKLFIVWVKCIDKIRMILTISSAAEQLIVPNKKLRHTIQMTNDRPVYIVID